MLAYIRLLYDVERGARHLNLNSEKCQALRLANAVRSLDDIKAYLERERPKVLHKNIRASHQRRIIELGSVNPILRGR